MSCYQNPEASVRRYLYFEKKNSIFDGNARIAKLPIITCKCAGTNTGLTSDNSSSICKSLTEKIVNAFYKNCDKYIKLKEKVVLHCFVAVFILFNDVAFTK